MLGLLTLAYGFLMKYWSPAGLDKFCTEKENEESCVCVHYETQKIGSWRTKMVLLQNT